METRTKALMASKPQDENIVKQRANQGRKVFRKKSNTKGKAARLFPWDGEESNCLEVLNKKTKFHIFLFASKEPPGAFSTRSWIISRSSQSLSCLLQHIHMQIMISNPNPWHLCR